MMMEMRLSMTDLLPKALDWSPSLLAPCHVTVRRLYEYWEQKRGQRRMPARSDLDPVDMKALLPDLILIDVVPDERRYVYRLVGTREVEMRGGDPTGKAVKDAYYAESAAETMTYLDRVVATHGPVLYRGTYQPTSTRTQEEDVLFLPLSKDDRSCDMILIYGRIQWVKDEPQV
jgi:hypothetical protein